jgi:hypothetical protein
MLTDIPAVAILNTGLENEPLYALTNLFPIKDTNPTLIYIYLTKILLFFKLNHYDYILFLFVTRIKD